MTVPADITRELGAIASSYTARLDAARKGLAATASVGAAYLDAWNAAQAIRNRAIAGGATAGEIDAAIDAAVPAPTETPNYNAARTAALSSRSTFRAAFTNGGEAYAYAAATYGHYPAS